jgi:hypothetical protein
VNEQNYDTMKRIADASLADLFTGSYEDFTTKRVHRFESERYESSISDARQELRVALPDDAVKAWRDCVLRDSSDLFVWIDNIDASGATLGVGWKPSRGLGALQAVEVDLDGGTADQLTVGKTIPPGEATFIIRRGSQNAAVRGIINGRAGNPEASFSTRFYIPSLPSGSVGPPSSSFREMLTQGRPLTIKMDHLTGCIGSILRDGLYTVSYVRQRRGWIAEGDHGDGACPPKTRDRISNDSYSCDKFPRLCNVIPEDRKLVIWGVTFTFDDQGRVFADGTGRVGTILTSTAK